MGSYEFNVPLDGQLHWSVETFRILGLNPGLQPPTLDGYIQQVVHPEDQALVREGIARLVTKGALYDLQYRIMRPDGSIRHVHSVAETVLGARRKVVKIVGALQDITHRKELEQSVLEISEREQRRIGQDLHDSLCQQLVGVEFRLVCIQQELERKSEKVAEKNQ